MPKKQKNLEENLPFEVYCGDEKRDLIITEPKPIARFQYKPHAEEFQRKYWPTTGYVKHKN